jgi:hypothetical protein
MLSLQLATLSEGDREDLGYILKAAIVIDDIFYEQVTSFIKCFPEFFVLFLIGWTCHVQLVRKGTFNG